MYNNNQNEKIIIMVENPGLHNNENLGISKPN